MSNKGLKAAKPIDLNNCPVRERTGDGVSVGRCWHFLGREDAKVCPRHGDVTEQVVEYTRTGRLQEDPRDE